MDPGRKARKLKIWVDSAEWEMERRTVHWERTRGGYGRAWSVPRGKGINSWPDRSLHSAAGEYEEKSEWERESLWSGWRALIRGKFLKATNQLLQPITVLKIGTIWKKIVHKPVANSRVCCPLTIFRIRLISCMKVYIWSKSDSKNYEKIINSWIYSMVTKNFFPIFHITVFQTPFGFI